MKKIIAAFNGLRFSNSTMEYAIFLAQQSNASLSGIFFSEHTLLGYALYETVIKQSLLGKSILDVDDIIEKILESGGDVEFVENDVFSPKRAHCADQVLLNRAIRF
jgi:hypothetical protein